MNELTMNLKTDSVKFPSMNRFTTILKSDIAEWQDFLWREAPFHKSSCQTSGNQPQYGRACV